jgi:hypothetical protein
MKAGGLIRSDDYVGRKGHRKNYDITSLFHGNTIDLIENTAGLYL